MSDLSILPAEENENTFAGEIKVASRIIDYLSSGLYHTPAACLKELINNSYDAKATRVDVFIKPDADRIVIADDGEGMSREEFEKHFNRVSESHKRDESDKTEGVPPTGGRPKIGKIGIGFIAANELCEVLEIFSTKQGSNDLLHVTIDFQEMRKPIEERRRGEALVKADYTGEILPEKNDAHYTQLFLTSVRGNAKEILASALSTSAWADESQGANPQDTQKINSKITPVRSLYGLKADSVAEVLRDPKLDTWSEFDMYSSTMLAVGLNVPVQYHTEWLPSALQEKVADLDKETRDLGFKVFYDGSELKKPIILFPPRERAFIHRFSFEGEYVGAHGYFYAQGNTIQPRDLQGLLIRIRHAAISEYDHSFLDFSPSEYPLIQRWISAEIWADTRLEEAMNIDRRTLRIAHPAYVELRNAIHKELRVVLKRALSEIYEAGSKERKQHRVEDVTRTISNLVNENIAPVAPKAAQQMRKSLSDAVTEPKAQKALQKKYTVAEFYEIVVEIAKDNLPPEQLDNFLQSLTTRLGL